MRRLFVVVLAATAPLAACASVKESVKGPNLTPVGTSATQAAQTTPVGSLAAIRTSAPQAASSNSLWRTGARAFFIDQRAGRVGDILTVLITINDSANISNATASERKSTNNAGLSNLFGLEKLLGKSMTPSSVVNTNSDLLSNGTGSVVRQDQISLTIAAVVTQVLPNGNLVIQGKQEVKTNNDVRELTVAGIVRPEDITSTNTINHTQIAEARISYGGRGDMANAQKAAVGTSLLTKFLPF
jgi:flagellar L-ring protein precursor FlgH